MSRIALKAVLVASLVLCFVHQAAAQRPANGDRAQTPFQQVFSIRGVEFTEEQQAEVDKLRENYTPKLREINRGMNELYTREQRRARRTALEEARQKNLRGEELQAALDEAIQLTEEQMQKRAELQKQREKLIEEIQKLVQAQLTEQQRRQLQGRRNRGPAIRPTHPNVKYGPHQRNVMDVWLAESNQPTPVLVSIHGGGFRGGNKSVDRNLLQRCLKSGISVVAITYRLSDEAIAPAQHHDSARAIQFIRHNAKEWNLDSKRIASTGGSAGAGLSLWLGFHDDLADPDNEDPVLRQSTRLSCMAVYNGQTSYDPRVIRDLIPEGGTHKHAALAQLYDVNLEQLDELPKEKYDLFEEVSAINHLTKDDAPAMLFYATKLDTKINNPGVGIHHPRFGQMLKRKMDEFDIPCVVLTGTQRGSEEWLNRTMEFVLQNFGMKPAEEEPSTGSRQ